MLARASVCACRVFSLTRWPSALAAGAILCGALCTQFAWINSAFSALGHDCYLSVSAGSAQVYVTPTLEPRPSVMYEIARSDQPPYWGVITTHVYGDCFGQLSPVTPHFESGWDSSWGDWSGWWSWRSPVPLVNPDHIFPVWIAATPAGLLACAGFAAHRRLPRPGHCSKCRYFIGNAARCPECGRLASPTPVPTP